MLATDIPYVNYMREDKSSYSHAKDKGWIDKDDDFLLGDSGGFLFNSTFTFVNTHLLRPAAYYYENFKTYCLNKIDTAPYVRFIVQEELRRKHGFMAPCKMDKNGIVHNLRISGEHYNFLNYGRMNKLDASSVMTTAQGTTGDKKEGFPDFFASQYWWYKSKEFSKHNGFNLIVGKSRRAGFSYMEGVGTANTINLIPKMTVGLAAFDKKYLTKGNAIAAMAFNQCMFYEEHTPFKRGIISRDLEDFQLGYYDRNRNPKGYQSRMISVSSGPDNPDCLIGKDCKEIKCEELSNFPNFNAFMNVTEPTIRTGAISTGMIVAFGTGGSKEGKWEVFEANFYNPGGAYRFMPFENIFDKDSRHSTCGYFKPYVESLQGYLEDGTPSMDAHGNTDYDVAAQILTKERADAKRDAKTPQDYITYCGQYANMPSESFGSTNENMFTSPELLLHIDKLKYDPTYSFYTDGMPVSGDKGIVFKSNARLDSDGNVIHHYIDDLKLPAGGDPHGCLRMYYPPYRDPKTGNIPGGLYKISFDPFGVDKDKDELTTKHSAASFKVWMMPSEYFPNIQSRVVASFFGRPNSMEDVDKIMLNTSILYGNAEALVEVNRGETVQNFRKWKRLDLLSLEPNNVWDNKIKEADSKSYGIVIGDGLKKINGLIYLKELMYEVVAKKEDGSPKYLFEEIYDLGYLNELLKFSHKGNYDRISDAIVHAYDRKRLELNGKAKVIKEAGKDPNDFWNREYF